MTHIVVVKMWLTEAGRREVHDYEDAVVRLMGEHQGRLVAAFTPARDGRRPGGGSVSRAGGRPGLEASDDAERCDLVHVLEFASEEAFRSFLADPERRARAAQRERLFSETEVLEGPAV